MTLPWSLLLTTTQGAEIWQLLSFGVLENRLISLFHMHQHVNLTSKKYYKSLQITAYYQKRHNERQASVSVSEQTSYLTFFDALEELKGSFSVKLLILVG